jgi:hypothetical protein
MKSLKKTTLASLVGAAALATAGAANATIVVGGDNGYEFSVDGNINNFYIHSDQDKYSNDTLGGQENNEVANGLLPTFFGFNISAPEVNGLKIGARVSISPSTNNFTTGSGSFEQREAFATVDGSFGQVLFGKALGLYGSNSILMEQTLFGVGATGITAAGNQSSGSTTLGRIGWGYDYAFWRSQFRYTTPDMNGFQVAVAVVDAENTGDGSLTHYEADPRFEAQLTYAGAFDNGSFKLFVEGMTQEVEQGTTGSTVSSDANAWTAGGQLKIAGFEFGGAYYDNEGVGAAGGILASSTGTDSTGEEREGEGYWVQAGYRFAGTTLVSISHGESELDQTSAEKAGTIVPTAYSFADLETNTMTTVGIYHDVTPNLKLVAEYTDLESEFHSGGEDAETDIFAVGAFVTW